MAEKVTVMVLKVDLQCPCCYKKVKKILCKFPQIRDQIFDKKGNKVTITVVCCSPEKIRDKLCYKGSRVIKSIEIKEPPKPKDPEKPKQPEKPNVVVIEKPKEPEKPKQPEKPNVVVVEKPKELEKPNVVVIEKPKEPEKPKVIIVEKPKEPEKPKEAPKPKNVTFEMPKDAPKPKDNGAPPPEKPKEAPKTDPPKNPGPAPGPPKMPDPISFPVPAQGYPPAFPMQPCCAPCYEGYGGGPCYQGYGVPPPPQPCYDGYYGYNNGYPGRSTHMTRCDYYYSEENPQGCSIM